MGMKINAMDLLRLGFLTKKSVGVPSRTRVTYRCALPAFLQPYMPVILRGLYFNVDPTNLRAYPSMTQEQVLELMSPGLTTTTNVYYVDMINGNDTNDGRSWGSAFQNLSRVSIVTTASGQKARCFVKGGNSAYIYGRAYCFAGASNIRQTVDILWIASGGIIDVSTHENGSKAFTPVANQPGVYTLTGAAAANLFNMAQRCVIDGSQFLWHQPKIVAAATDTYTAEGTMHYDGTTLTFHTFQNAVATIDNIRCFKQGMPFSVASDVVVGFLGETSGDGWQLMGGGAGSGAGLPGWHFNAGFGGSIEYNAQSQGAPAANAPKGLIGRNITTGFGYRGLAVDSVNGLVWLHDYRNMGQVSDAVNGRSVRTTSLGLTIISQGNLRRNGTVPNQSCQAVTFHDARMAGWTVMCDYDECMGGQHRHIGGAKVASSYDGYGTDRGDRPSGGGVDPADVQIDDAGTEMYVEYPRFRPGSPVNLRALNGTSIRCHSPACPVRWQKNGSGTVTLTPQTPAY